MAAGVSHWCYGDFGLFRVNPPLVRMIATLPVVLTSPKTDWRRASTAPALRSEFIVGADFIAANHDQARFLFCVARWACIPFSLMGACVCYLWAAQLYGRASGSIALVLWCSSPAILGHAPTIGPDVAAAAFGVAAAYAFWKCLNEPTWRTVCVAGLMLGFAELTKLTWIVLFLLWPTVLLLWTLCRAEPKSERTTAREVCCEGPRPWLFAGLQLSLILLLAIFVINLGYGFQKTFQGLGNHEFVSECLAHPHTITQIDASKSNRFAGTWLGDIPVPLPEDYVMGIDRQKWDFERGMPSYLRGEWADHGWWYYYGYALAIKVPLGTWCLITLAIGLTILGRGYSASWRDEMVVLTPGLAVLLFVSSQTGFSVHSRYVLPAMPFFFVWASKVGRVFEMRPITRTRRLLGVAVAIALSGSVTSSLWTYPHSLSYFNELVGGPRRGGEHLLDSNIDWGQDLFYLSDWLDQHSDVVLGGMACPGYCPTSLASIPKTSRPPEGPTMQGVFRDSPETLEHVGPRPGCYAVSVDSLFSRERQYVYFQHFRSIATAGYSIYIYNITLEDANRVRRELGLPELPDEKPEEDAGAYPRE